MIMGNFSNSILPQPNDSYSANAIRTTSDDQYLSADIEYAYRLLNCSDYECFTPKTTTIATSSIPTTSASIITGTSIPTISASNTNGGTTISSISITSASSTNGGTSASGTNGGTTIISVSISSANGGSSISTSVRPTTSSTGSPTPSSSSAQVQGK